MATRRLVVFVLAAALAIGGAVLARTCLPASGRAVATTGTLRVVLIVGKTVCALQEHVDTYMTVRNTGASPVTLWEPPAGENSFEIRDASGRAYQEVLGTYGEQSEAELYGRPFALAPGESMRILAWLSPANFVPNAAAGTYRVRALVWPWSEEPRAPQAPVARSGWVRIRVKG